jgi:hypothetical protein
VTATISRYRRSITEAGMQEAIQRLVNLRGGRLYHVRRSDVAPELVDLPDLLLILPDLQTVAFLELKSPRRQVTPGQQEVLAMLAECRRVESMIVRPEPRLGEVGYDAALEWLAT